MARGRGGGAWWLVGRGGACSDLTRFSVLPTTDLSNHQSHMNQSGVSGNDFSGRLFIQARRSKHSFSHVRMSWTTQKLRKKYIDENLGENPKLSNRLMNFAEFASVRSRQNTVL